jgi:hypothetical protein
MAVGFEQCRTQEVRRVTWLAGSDFPKNTGLVR